MALALVVAYYHLYYSDTFYLLLYYCMCYRLPTSPRYLYLLFDLLVYLPTSYDYYYHDRYHYHL